MPDAATPNLVLKVECGQSITVKVGDTLVQIIAGDAGAPPKPDNGQWTPPPPPEIVPATALGEQSVAYAIRPSSWTIDLDEYLENSIPVGAGTKGLAGQLFEIKGVGGIALLDRTVPQDNYLALGVTQPRTSTEPDDPTD